MKAEMECGRRVMYECDWAVAFVCYANTWLATWPPHHQMRKSLSSSPQMQTCCKHLRKGSVRYKSVQPTAVCILTDRSRDLTSPCPLGRAGLNDISRVIDVHVCL